MLQTVQYPELPVTKFLPDIFRKLDESPSRTLVLTAETGAGKSTLVPTYIAEHTDGKVLILQPRRLAAVAVASRIASILGEKPGASSGYIVKNDSRVGPDTRIISMTEAVLSRAVIDDPSLEGVSAVVLDEFHERSIHSDFAAALLKEVKVLRPDLRILVMSAAFETERVCAYFDAPLERIAGRVWPVDITYMPPRERERLEETVLRAVRAENSDGDVLVFLPGIAEIQRTRNTLMAAGVSAEILALHSSVSLDEQRRVLEGSDERGRIILSTTIAETSITVPGITTVIDSGLSRITRFQNRTGMDRLVTEPENEFSAVQRAGRAGRTQPGRCIRLWSESDMRPRGTPAEILRSDLSPLVLDCALWQRAERGVLSWLDDPPEPAWDGARSLLELLGAIDAKGLPLLKGKQMSRLGIHPRAASVLLSAAESAGAEVSGGNAGEPAMRARVPGTHGFSPDDVRAFTAILQDQGKRRGRVSALLEEWKRVGGDAAWRARVRTQADDLARRTSALFRRADIVRLNAGELALGGYPDRIARHVPGSAGLYQFTTGRAGALVTDEVMSLSDYPEYVAVIAADAGEREGKIYVYEPVSAAEAERILTAKARKKTEFVRTGGGVRKVTKLTCGELVLKETSEPLTADDTSALFLADIASSGLTAFPWADASESFIARLVFRCRRMGALNGRGGTSAVPNALSDGTLTELLAAYFASMNAGTDGGESKDRLPDGEAVRGFLEKMFRERAEEWFVPFLAHSRGAGRLTESGFLDALRSAAGWQNARDIDALVPEYIEVPSGARKKLDYRSGDFPVLEVKIQELFGLAETPEVCGVPVTLHLLSPAHRPVQITRDLASFWKNTWPSVVKELKGRYPKHPWPDDPLSARATWKTKNRQ